jgi:hypothetical protein
MPRDADSTRHKEIVAQLQDALGPVKPEAELRDS